MKFTKMHGIGNDYVYVNCFKETVNNPSAVAKFVSDRHFGIGSDGLILIKPSAVADCEMDMYNLDGSQGAMCGNGIRCVAKYAYDYGIVNKTSISVATKSGIKYLDLTLGDDGKVALVKVNMGSPILTANQIPIVSGKEQVIDEQVFPWEIHMRSYIWMTLTISKSKKSVRNSKTTLTSRTVSIQNLSKSLTATHFRCVSGNVAPAKPSPAAPVPAP